MHRTILASMAAIAIATTLAACGGSDPLSNRGSCDNYEAARAAICAACAHTPSECPWRDEGSGGELHE